MPLIFSPFFAAQHRDQHCHLNVWQNCPQNSFTNTNRQQLTALRFDMKRQTPTKLHKVRFFYSSVKATGRSADIQSNTLKTDHNLLSFYFSFSFLSFLVGGVACMMPSGSYQAHNKGYDPPIPDCLLIFSFIKRNTPSDETKSSPRQQPGQISAWTLNTL